jgi:undecaprenyl-diphosphatase
LVTAPVVWPLLAFTSWILWRQKRFIDALGVFCAVTIPALVALAAKSVYHLPRPAYSWAIETHWSAAFPSGHVAIIFTLCGLTAFIGQGQGKSALWTLTVVAITVAATALMAYSRVALGAHFFSDVLGGICLGFIWLPTIIRMMASASTPPVTIQPSK